MTASCCCRSKSHARRHSRLIGSASGDAWTVASGAGGTGSLRRCQRRRGRFTISAAAACADLQPPVPGSIIFRRRQRPHRPSTYSSWAHPRTATRARRTQADADAAFGVGMLAGGSWRQCRRGWGGCRSRSGAAPMPSRSGPASCSGVRPRDLRGARPAQRSRTGSVVAPWSQSAEFPALIQRPPPRRGQPAIGAPYHAPNWPWPPGIAQPPSFTQTKRRVLDTPAWQVAAPSA